MKRTVVFAYLCTIFSLCGFAQALPTAAKIDINEVTVDYPLEEVKVFTGTYTEATHTASQIRSVGQHLGEQIAAKKEFADDWLKNRYSVRRFSDADVFYVGKEAKVDTVKNLIRILAGYIEVAYDMPSAQADRLALLICAYNASHANDVPYFSQRFSDETINSFSTAQIGLPPDYTDWAGNIKLIIPFSPVKVKQVSAPQNLSTDKSNPPPQTKESLTPSTPIQNPPQSPQVKTVDSVPQSKNNTFMWIIILAAAVLLIGGIGAAYVIFTRKQQTLEDENNKKDN